jgi:uncharacterized protein (PEP-CTERM system associated)
MKIANGSLRRFALGLSGLAAGLTLAIAGPASAGPTQIVPYLEVEQVLSADLNEGDTLTYTSVAVGVDATTETRRVQAQVSYRYERRIAWEGDVADDDIHTGLAQMRAVLVPNTVTFNAGALATRARTGAGAPIFGFNGADSRDLADVYSVYAGPDFSTRAGPLDVTASYRLGYVKVDDHSLADLPVLPGARSDRFNSAVNHSVSASVGMAPGHLPFGWTVGAGYVREDVKRLDQEFEGKFIRGDVVLPVSPTFAVTAGVGYEKTEASQQDFRRDANGDPIFTPGGNLVGDPSRPRLLAYDQDGVIWDAGVIWRPSRRTELQARFGRRYGSETFVGSFRHEINSAYAITGSVYDSVDSFGRIIVADLKSMPTNFQVSRNPLNPGVGGIGGCVFGKKPGTGACLGDALQSISSTNFRHRGANFLLSGGRGPWSFGIGAGYAQRKYLAPDVLNGFSLNRVKDESATINASMSRDLSRTSGISADAYAAWYDSDRLDSSSSFGTGITGSYYRSIFYDRLQAHAAIGLYTTESDEFESTVAQALIGLRYSF